MTHLIIYSTPPSINNLYRVFRGRAILSEKVREYKKFLAQELPPVLVDLKEKKHDYYELKIVFTIPRMLKKDGKINLKSGDVDNMCKVLIDGIFDSIDDNDSKITSLVIEKCDGDTRKTEVTIWGFNFN